MKTLTSAELRQAINDTHQQALTESPMSFVMRDHLNKLVIEEIKRATTQECNTGGAWIHKAHSSNPYAAELVWVGK